MTINITLKNAANADVTFQVVRQPSGTQSAILYEVSSDTSMNRTGLAKIELSARLVNGKSNPVSSVVVPYGSVVDGAFVKKGQVSDTRTSVQPADTPATARADAEAFARNLASNAQVTALFANGLI